MARSGGSSDLSWYELKNGSKTGTTHTPVAPTADLKDKSGKYVQMGEDLGNIAVLEASIQNSLKARGLLNGQIDDIILNSQILDEAIGGGKKFISTLEEIVKNPGFKNAEDLEKLFYDAVKTTNNNKLNFLAELEEGKYWLDKGHEVTISKIWSGGNEIDVVNHTDKMLIEHKRVIGGEDQIKQNINSIIGKFNTPSRLSSTNRFMFGSETRYIGVVQIESSNPYFNFDKEAFKKALNDNFIDKIEGINLSDIKTIHELVIKNGKERFTISNTEW